MGCTKGKRIQTLRLSKDLATGRVRLCLVHGRKRTGTGPGFEPKAGGLKGTKKLHLGNHRVPQRVAIKPTQNNW